MIPAQINGVPLTTDGSTSYAFFVQEATRILCDAVPVNALGQSASFVLINATAEGERREGHTSAAVITAPGSVFNDWLIMGCVVMMVV